MRLLNRWSTVTLRPHARQTRRWLGGRFWPSLEELEPRTTPSADVLMYHNDPSLSGANLNEPTLRPGNVNPTTFGKLFDQTVDGYVYAQPLFKAGVTISGKGTHDVVFVATENNTVYAFDAESNTGGNALPLWQTNLGPAVPSGDIPQETGTYTDIVPVVGITGTPVIDPNTNTLYVVAKTEELTGVSGKHFRQRLHALDITTGMEQPSFPILIGDTVVGGAEDGYTNSTNVVVPGDGIGSDGMGNLRFNALTQHQRGALSLANGLVYIPWASHSDSNPYHGWVVGYNPSTRQPQVIINTTPDTPTAPPPTLPADKGGVWESGAGVSVDASGNVYFAVGNGTFDNAFPDFLPDFGESVLKYAPCSTSCPTLPADFFTPHNFDTMNTFDLDEGVSGAMLLPDSAGSQSHPHLLVQRGKIGTLYLIDRDGMGGFNATSDNVVQEYSGGLTGFWSNPVYYNGQFYYQGTGDARHPGGTLDRFQIQNGMFTLASQINTDPTFPPAQLSISAQDSRSNGILWSLDVTRWHNSDPSMNYTVLRAYDPATLAELYNSESAMGSRDRPVGAAVKFTVPTVTNGRVYVGTDGKLTVYGLFTPAPNFPVPPPPSSNPVESGAAFSWGSRDDFLAGIGSDQGTANALVALTAPGETAFNGAEQQAVAPSGRGWAFKIPGPSAYATGLEISPDGVWDALDTPGVNATGSVL